jgi:seryl-tRNA synthetase
MIDLKALRERRDELTELLQRRGVERGEIDELYEIDQRCREVSAERDHLRSEVNALSKVVGEAMRERDLAKAEVFRQRSRELGERVADLEAEVTELEGERSRRHLLLPNLPANEVPIGRGEEDNVILRYFTPAVGDVSPEEFELPEFAPYQRVPHWDIGVELGILEMSRAAKLSGSMFALYRGMGSRLLRALTSFALDAHGDQFEELRPPTLVKRETMVSTGHLPKFAEDAYAIDSDDLYAIPTAEVPLTSFFRDEILPEAALPARFTAATACFRREAGSAGRDTRGLLRLHEFDKVELVALCSEAQVSDVFDDMLARAEGVLRALGICYRVLGLCSGDLGGSAAKTYDLEAYSPGTGKWLEVSSVSWCSDYQARRANIRYRRESGEGTALVHTLNGSALAWARVWAVIVENGRQSDGTVLIPEPLRPYLGGRDRISPREHGF